MFKIRRSILSLLTSASAVRRRPSQERIHRSLVRHAAAHGLRVERLEDRSLMAADMFTIDPSMYERDQFLVRFQSPEAASQFADLPSGGVWLGEQLTDDGWYQVNVSPDVNIEQALLAFQNRTDVSAATPDFRVNIDVAPNDTSYASQWGLENNGASGGLVDADIDAQQAWQYGTSSSVVVAVIDTGVDYNHPDLANNIWRNSAEIAGDGIDNDNNGYVDDIRGWNFVSNNNNPMDDNNHGTHVSGTIGALGNNSLGVAGVVWDVDIMPLKFLDASGSGLLSAAISAIDYARSNGAKIINASWGGGGFSSALQSAIQRFQNAGGIFVAAAGNESSNNAAVVAYPANYSGVISVAASTRTDTLASFSNYGTNVEIAAPGSSILSTIAGGGYASYSGTSMAAPHVAGALALLWGQSPSTAAADLVNVLMSTTDNVLRDRTTFGRMNLGRAAEALHNGGGTPVDSTSPYVSNATWVRSGNAITAVDVTFSEAVAPATVSNSTITVNGPAGPIAIASITALDTSNTKWRVSFGIQSATGTYSIQIGPAVTDLAGNLMDQDRDGTAGEVTQDVFSSQTTIEGTRNYTALGPIQLADATRTRTGVTRVRINIPDSFTIGDLNVDVSIRHTYISDLGIRLIGPDGSWVRLINRRGGSSDDLRVIFDDAANTAITAAPTNFSGTYRPEGPLSFFNSKNASGAWTLELTDYAAADVGILDRLTLIFTPAATGNALSLASGIGNATVPSANDSADLAPIVTAPNSLLQTRSQELSLNAGQASDSLLANIVPSRTRANIATYTSLVDELFRWWP